MKSRKLASFGLLFSFVAFNLRLFIESRDWFDEQGVAVFRSSAAVEPAGNVRSVGTWDEDCLLDEFHFKTIIQRTVPLMKVLRVQKWPLFTYRLDPVDGKNRSQRSYNIDSYYDPCCYKSFNTLSNLSIAALGVFLYFLYRILTSTTAAARRSLSEEPGLDATVWLSSVDQMWLASDPECVRLSLCNMMKKVEGWQAGPFLLSSVPLSYLLHKRHNTGFLPLLQSAFQGTTSGDCLIMYNKC